MARSIRFFFDRLRRDGAAGFVDMRGGLRGLQSAEAKGLPLSSHPWLMSFAPGCARPKLKDKRFKIPSSHLPLSVKVYFEILIFKVKIQAH